MRVKCGACAAYGRGAFVKGLYKNTFQSSYFCVKFHNQKRELSLIYDK